MSIKIVDVEYYADKKEYVVYDYKESAEIRVESNFKARELAKYIVKKWGSDEQSKRQITKHI